MLLQAAGVDATARAAAEVSANNPAMMLFELGAVWGVMLRAVRLTFDLTSPCSVVFTPQQPKIGPFMVNGKSLEVAHHLPGGWVLLGANVIGNNTVYEAAAKLSSDGTESHDVITAKTMVKLSTGQRAIVMGITARNEKPTSETCLATQPVPNGKMKLVRVTNAVILPGAAPGTCG